MQHNFVAHSIVSAQIGFRWNSNKFLRKNFFFHLYNPKSPFLSLPIAAKFLKMTSTGATPGQIFHGTNHLARLPPFQGPGVSGSKVILLGKNTNIFQIFFLRLSAAKFEIHVHN